MKNYSKLINRSMASKIERGEAIDLQYNKKTPEGHYILKQFEEDSDYCDAYTEEWIWSIGKRHSDGVILASTGGIFYDNPDFLCIWLR